MTALAESWPTQWPAFVPLPTPTCAPYIVIPGLDPGMTRGGGGWGDPRIKSGDDDDGDDDVREPSARLVTVHVNPTTQGRNA